jgi:hypothetical protein
VKFQADTSGFITGIRFYKGAANGGTHIANLWSSSGSLLASATFTGESASGWQQADFGSPVAITANTTYVASYHMNRGAYASSQNYFATGGVDNSPLHALPSGTSGGNGVYTYGAASAFPTTTFNAANYWVDLVFNTTATGPTSTPTPQATNTPTPPATNTPTPQATNTPAPQATDTPTPQATSTPTSQPTSTPTPQPSNTPTAQPTNTPTAQPTNTPRPTSTPTRPPTPTPGSGRQIVTFDDLSSPGRPLTGQYPVGVIDWGSSGSWWLSGPFDQLTSNNVTFSAVGQTSTTFTFITPRQLISVDVDNGGINATTVTLTCAGQTPTLATLTPRQMTTIQTGWTSTCSSVTIHNPTGWTTHLKNFVIQ